MLFTDVVDTMNVAVVAPLAIVIDVGVFAYELLEFSATAVPEAGAGASRVIVPIAETPPGTVLGASESDEIPSGTINNVAVIEALS